MLNHQRYKNIVEARRTKLRIARLSSLAAKPKTLSKQSMNIAGFYQQKRRFKQRLSYLTDGQIALRDDYPFRGLNARNWVQQAGCEHVYLASLKEIFTVGAEMICPFCNVPEDLSRCGSVEAVRQNVESLSYSNVEFLYDNELSGPDDLYKFACLIHGFRFEGSYRDFIYNPEEFCHICAFDKARK